MTSPTLDNLQTAIHTLAELDTSVPSSSDTDYTVRTNLINKWIRAWENEEGVEWNQLWVVASFSNTGAASYSLVSSVSNMKSPGGYVEYVDTNGASLYWEVIPVDQVRLLTNNGERWCYFTGDPGAGFTLVFNPNAYPSGSTGNIKFPYYKKATMLSSGSDKTEVPDPYFIVHGVVADIYSTEDPAESDKNFQISQAKLGAMKTRNLTVPAWQSSSILNKMSLMGGRGFGI